MPPILFQFELCPRAGDKLPQARGFSVRVSDRVVGTFNKRQEGEFSGQAPTIDFLDDVIQIFTRAVGHAVHRLGVPGVVGRPFVDQWRVEIGDGKAPANPFPGVGCWDG